MSARRLLLIDPDENFFHILHEQVSPYGFEIYRAEPSPDALGYVDELRPELVFIAVEEPDKLGYSLCNKAKKGVAQDIPVILTTSSVPPSGFLSHRKLRVHADEYVDKRSMRTQELMFKIEQLIGLGELAAVDGPYDEIDDFELDDDAFGEDGERTRIAPPGMLGFELNADTADAVDALVEADHSFFEEDAAMSTSASIPQFFRDVPVEPESLAGYDSRRSETIVQEAQMHGQPPPPAPPPVPQAESSPLTGRHVRPSGGIRRPSNLDLGLDQVAQAPPSDPAMTQRLRDLEEENQRLQAELQAKPAAGGSSFSREREFLNLRELVNKKEREVLDLRDEVGSKERGILDGKEQIRQLEHYKTTLDAKNLELEQRLLEYQERLDASEKQKNHHLENSQKLEQAVADAQARTQGEIERMAAQLNEMQTSLSTAEAAAQEESARNASRLTDLEKRHEQELAAALEALKVEHEETLGQVKEQHNQALQKVTASHETVIGEMRESQLQERDALEQKHADASATAAAEHSEAIQALSGRNEREQAAKQAEDEQKFADLESAHQTAIESIENKAKDDLAAAEGERERAKAEAAEERSYAEAQMRDAFAAEKETLERIHQKALSELEAERKHAQIDLTAANGYIEGLEQRASEADQAIEEHLQTIAKCDTRIGSLEMDVEELENNNQIMQEQVLFAYQKIRTDEATVTKAKKALAIALTLLDDNITDLVEESAVGDNA